MKGWTWKYDILARSSLKGSVEACGLIFNVRLVWHDCVFSLGCFAAGQARGESKEVF